MEPGDLIKRYGEMGARLAHLSRGEDARAVHREAGVKSVSHETTFMSDITEYEPLAKTLLDLAEHVSERMKKHNLVGDTVQLKLKTAGFRIRTRARHLAVPTQLAHTIFEHASSLLAREWTAPPTG